MFLSSWINASFVSQLSLSAVSVSHWPYGSSSQSGCWGGGKKKKKNTRFDKHVEHLSMRLTGLILPALSQETWHHWISFITAKCPLSFCIYWVLLWGPSEPSSNCLLFCLHQKYSASIYDLLCWEKTFLCLGNVCLYARLWPIIFLKLKHFCKYFCNFFPGDFARQAVHIALLIPSIGNVDLFYYNIIPMITFYV